MNANQRYVEGLWKPKLSTVTTQLRERLSHVDSQVHSDGYCEEERQEGQIHAKNEPVLQHTTRNQPHRLQLELGTCRNHILVVVIPIPFLRPHLLHRQCEDEIQAPSSEQV